jgi:hypothetical protein
MIRTALMCWYKPHDGSYRPAGPTATAQWTHYRHVIPQRVVDVMEWSILAQLVTYMHMKMAEEGYETEHLHWQVEIREFPDGVG